MSDLYPVPEVAARLRCSEWAVRSLINTGVLRASKVASRWLVAGEDIDAAINQTSNRPRRHRARMGGAA